MKNKVLMVCLGNICRSPLAEGVLKKLVHDKKLSQDFLIDSAGTIHHHIGERPDSRSIEVAKNHGISLEHLGRQFTNNDFQNFNHILVMDESNYQNVIRLAKSQEEINKVHLITDFDMRSTKPKIVPDPYYGNINDFEEVYQQLNYCCEGFLSTLKI
jgi:protein-tyrosine phosphatase